MLIERVWAMPNSATFTIKPIKELLAEEVDDGWWCDPFAGKSTITSVKNDLNPELGHGFQSDALDFLKNQPSSVFDGVLYDPPYSFRQLMECYKGVGRKVTQDMTRMDYFSKCKTEIARITKPGGKVISFGWNSMGMGEKRGFTKTRILLVPHGGSRNDTIVTVEIKSAVPQPSKEEE